MTDQEILDKLRSGDEETTREYFYGWCRMAFNVCDKRYGLSEKDDMDFFSIAHDLYLRLAQDNWQGPERRSKEMKLSTWMVNGFRYVVLDRLKADAKQSDSKKLDKIDVADSNMYCEIQRLLNDLINGTYAGDAVAQYILRSMFVEGYTGKETAERLGISPSAVSQRYTSMMKDTIRPFFMKHLDVFPSQTIHRSSCMYEDASVLESPMGGFDNDKKESKMFGKLFNLKKSQEGSACADVPYDDAESVAMERITQSLIKTLADNEIFVFGSNLQGMHGGGAARIAYKDFGAEWGVGVGLTGRTYAIPTMQGGVETIAPYVDDFIAYAKEHPELKFLVTRIGCGIAGFDDSDIAPLFAAAKDVENIALPESFWEYIL